MHKKQRNYSLDLLKFISSFMIVCIHFKTAGRVGELVTIISRFAVPVFFMVSGYYAYNDNCDKIKNKIINIVKIYFVSVVIYFCFNIIVMVINGQFREAIWYVSTYFRIQYASKTILFNESITSIHLWFLGSLIYSYIIQCVIAKAKIKDNLIYVISCLLILTNLVFGIGLPALGIETPIFLNENYILRNYLFMGFPLFTLGCFIKKREEDILKVVSGKILILLVLLSFIDTLMVWKIDWTKDLYVGSILLAFALFVFALKKKDVKYSPRLINLFNTSIFLYIIHVMIGDIMEMTALEDIILYSYLKPVVIFALSVIASLTLNGIKEHCKIRKSEDN